VRVSLAAAMTASLRPEYETAQVQHPNGKSKRSAAGFCKAKMLESFLQKSGGEITDDCFTGTLAPR
jgi:hypothetical protein